MRKILSVRMFGGLDVSLGGKRVSDFGYDKARALFVYLLIEPPTPHNRDVLAGTFWPEQSEEAARHSLRQALSELRRALGNGGPAASLFLATRTSIQRNPQAALKTDLAAFESSLNGKGNDLEQLKRAASLYWGELLRGLSLTDTESFSEWLQLKREHYQSQAVAALDRLVRHFERQGDYEAAIRYARQILSLEPWREEAHRQLMLMLARSGKRAAALKQYELCRRHLREALEVDPEPETEKLFRRIQQTGSERSGLPTTLTRFIGRQSELNMLMGFFSDPSRRLITITGLGGVGKSRLAIEAGGRMARESCRRFLHGIVFMPLAGVRSQDQLVVALAQNLGLILSAERPAQSQVIGFLEDKELLLIFDNFEHLISKQSLELVSAILDSAPDVKLLVSSRSALELQGEQLLPLEGLPVPFMHSAAGFQRDAAAEGTAAHFFLSAIRRRRPGFKVPHGDLPNLWQICRTVEGMPLALELSAACTERLSLEEIQNQIERSLDLLETTCPNVPERQRSVHAVFETSWRQLTVGEQTVLARLSVFSGSFTREAAREVVGARDAVLARLASCSLLQQNGDGRRYHLHELLRQFSAEKLSSEQTAVVLNRHSDWFCRRLQALEAEVRGHQEETALNQMDKDFDNTRRAWHWAIEHGLTERTDQAAAGLHYYLTRRARFKEAAGLFAGVADSLRNGRSGLAKRALARILAFEGDLLVETSQREQAAGRLRESLRLIDSLALTREDLRPEQALACFRLAWLTDDAAQAQPLHERSLALYREIGDLNRVASGLAALGFLWKSAGELEKAEGCFQEGLRLRRRLKNPGLAAELSFHLGELRSRQGRFEESLRVFREGLSLARREHDTAREIRGLASMSTAYIYTGEFERAETALQRTIRLQQQAGCSSQLPETMFLLGWSIAQQARYEEAKVCGERLAGAITGLDRQPQRGLALAVIGASWLAQDQPARARDLLIKAIQELRAGWQVDWQGRRSAIQAILACTFCYLKELELARSQLASGLQTALEVRSLIAVLMLIPATALFWLKRGHTRRAREIYSVARAQPCVANSRWFDDVVSREFEKAENVGRPKSRRARRRRAHASGVWQVAERLRSDLDQFSFPLLEHSSTSKPTTPISARTSPDPGPGNNSEKSAALVT